MTDSPNPVDVHVGKVVRRIRRERGVSQETLGAMLKISFQQVQKYENGANRISASKLFAISECLNTPVSSFYEGLVVSPPSDLQLPEAVPVEAAAHAASSSLEERLARLPSKRRELAYQMLEHFLEGDGDAAAQTGC